MKWNIVNRFQYVIIEGKNHQCFLFHLVFHLGPLLFLMFVWDISNCFKHARRLMYADDLKLFLLLNSELDASHLQSD